MNGRQLTDARISQALRAHLPERAAAGLRERVLDQAATTAQQRPMPAFLAALTDADPMARRRSVLLAAALLAALALTVAAGVGAWLELQREKDPFSLEAPPNVDAYVVGAYEGLIDLPALTFTVVEVEGTKDRYFYDGSGTVRLDHWSNPANSQPDRKFRLFTADTMAERGDLNGRPIWREYRAPANPVSELARATGLPAACGTVWEYVGLEYLIGRPTHHVACDGSAMWMDVETTLPLRSINAQGGRGAAIQFDVVEFEVGPQPPALFVPPEGLAVISDLEYRCAVDPACESPASPAPSDPPIVTPPPAPGEFAAPPDVEAFVAEVLAGYETLPPLEMTVRRDGPSDDRTRYFYDGSGQQRQERYGSAAQPPTVHLIIGGRWYESFGLSLDGRTVWQDHGPVEDIPGVMDFGLSWKCVKGWEHRGFDLINDRPAHHLACGDSEVWVDREWLMAVRSQRKSDPLGYDTNVDELVDLQFVQAPAEMFELPKDACLGCSEAPSPRPDPSG